MAVGLGLRASSTLVMLRGMLVIAGGVFLGLCAWGMLRSWAAGEVAKEAAAARARAYLDDPRNRPHQ